MADRAPLPDAIPGGGQEASTRGGLCSTRVGSNLIDLFGTEGFRNSRMVYLPANAANGPHLLSASRRAGERPDFEVPEGHTRGTLSFCPHLPS